LRTFPARKDIQEGGRTSDGLDYVTVREGNLFWSFSLSLPLESRKRLELTLKGFAGRFVIDYGDAKVIKRLRLLV
jgi:hypothetical protein